MHFFLQLLLIRFSYLYSLIKGSFITALIWLINRVGCCIAAVVEADPTHLAVAAAVEAAEADPNHPAVAAGLAAGFHISTL